MRLPFFGAKKSDEQKAHEQQEKARLAQLRRQQKEIDARAHAAAKEERARVKREQREWKKHEKQLRAREKKQQQQEQKLAKIERNLLRKLQRQHAKAHHREKRRARKRAQRDRRRLKKLAKLQRKQERAKNPALFRHQIEKLLNEIEQRNQQQQQQQPTAVDVGTAAATTPAMVTATPAFTKRQSCVACRSRFRVTRVRHHCRNCGESCCRKCLSDVKRPIPWQGVHKPQKVCRACDTLVFSDRTASSLAADSPASGGGVSVAAAAAPPGSASSVNSADSPVPDVESPPVSSSSSASRRPTSGSGISVSLSSRSRRFRHTNSGSSLTSALSSSSGAASSAPKVKKPSLWTLPIRPLLKRKRSVEQLRNRQLDLELQLEKAAQLSRQGHRALQVELQPQHSTLAAPFARAS